MVFADRDKISQVISNLAGNAVKYCGEDKYVGLTIRKAGRKYRLEVSDHGPGIKPEELPRNTGYGSWPVDCKGDSSPA